MALSDKEIADLKELIKSRVDNFPNLDDLVSAGKLKKKRAWYQVSDPETFDLIKYYVTEMLHAKDGTLQVKLQKPTKQLRNLASRI